MMLLYTSYTHHAASSPHPTLSCISLHPLPTQISSVYPLAIIHVLGNVLTNVSLGKVAVSFTHTVKAMEPFFSVIMSAIFLGSVPPVPVLLTLLPIVGGVLLASLTETTFNWTGFLAAMFSNITFQSRNVLSKKFMISKVCCMQKPPARLLPGFVALACV